MYIAITSQNYAYEEKKKLKVLQANVTLIYDRMTISQY